MKFGRGDCQRFVKTLSFRECKCRDSMIEDFRQILPGCNLPQAALAVGAIERGERTCQRLHPVPHRISSLRLMTECLQLWQATCTQASVSTHLEELTNVCIRDLFQQRTAAGQQPAKHKPAAANRFSATHAGSSVRQLEQCPASVERSDQQRHDFQPAERTADARPQQTGVGFAIRQSEQRAAGLLIRCNRTYRVRIPRARTITTLITAADRNSSPLAFRTAAAAPAAAPPARAASFSRLT